MNYSFVFVVSASIAVLGSAALAESPGVTRLPACERAAPNEKAMESLRDNAQAARRELRLLIKGPAASLHKMKIVELDELIDRLKGGDTVSYEEVDHAMRPPAIFMAIPP